MVGGAAVGVDEDDLAGVDSVHGNELPNEDLVRAVPVQDLEPERQRVAHLRGGLDVLAGSVRDLHRHVRRVHDHLQVSIQESLGVGILSLRSKAVARTDCQPRKQQLWRPFPPQINEWKEEGEEDGSKEKKEEEGEEGREEEERRK